MKTEIIVDPLYIRHQWRNSDDIKAEFIPLTNGEELAYKIGIQHGKNMREDEDE